MIVAYTVSRNRDKFSLELHPLNLSYSKTGSIKLNTKHPIYYKKDVVDSYEIVQAINVNIMIFTSEFNLDKNKAFNLFITYWIDNTKSQVMEMNNHINLLKSWLTPEQKTLYLQCLTK